MADKYFKEWKNALDKFSECVSKDLAEIRRCKAEMQSMKIDVQNMLSGKYVRDDDQIVISAPKIIIGNVDQNGVLKASSDSSEVIIRANTVDIEGVGQGGGISGGSITQRASIISSIAVDPGIDGQESVVCSQSQIVNQARSILLSSNDDEKVFISQKAIPHSGITLASDSKVNIDASSSSLNKSANIQMQTDNLKSVKTKLTDAVADKQKVIDFMFEAMNLCLKEQEPLSEDEAALFSNLTDIDTANDKFDVLKQALPPLLNDYMTTVSQLAEVNRQITDLAEIKKKVDSIKGTFKEQTTNANVNIKGESINLISVDGDGNLRTNKEASINLQAQSVNVSSYDEKSKLMEKGRFSVNTRNIDLSTADQLIKDDKNRENPAIGDITITSKNIKVEALDYETKDNKQQIKNHTKDSRLSMRIENVDILAVDKEGASLGTFSVNAKTMQLKSMDVDKEKLTDKKLAAGSSMVMVSEKMYGGSMDDKNKSKNLQLTAENVAVIAKTTAEIQQEKAVVQLDGGKLAAGGSATALYGDLTVNAKSEFKGDIQAGKASIDNVEAKTSFKSATISDGIAVPAPPSTAQLNAKLKEENPPKSK